MSLDWGKGFGVSLRTNVSNDSFTNSVRNLCFFPQEMKDNIVSDFPLYIDRKRLLCAQIPGILPNETYFIDLLEMHPEASMIVIDFVSNERVFLSDMRMLSTNILSQLEETKFNKLGKAMIGQLSKVIEVHESLLSDVESIAKEHSQDFLAQFIDKLVNNPVILERHRVYLEAYLQYEPTAVSLSVDEAHKYHDILGGRVITQIMKAPIEWQTNVATIGRRLIKITENAQHEGVLNSFITKLTELTQTIDSIPKLEQLSKQFVTEPFPVVVQGRRLLKTGTGIKLCRKTDSLRTIILCSDVFIYVQNKAGMYVAPVEHKLIQLRVAVEEGRDNLLLIYGRNKSFKMDFKQKSERDAWLEEFQAAIQNARDNWLNPIEPYREAPIWIQDKEAAACMGCETKFTVIRRRHHCRVCGGVFCGRCLKRNALLPWIDETKAVMLCEKCYTKEFPDAQ